MIILPRNGPAWISKLESDQIQPAGVDLTVQNIQSFEKTGKLGVKSTDRVIPEKNILQPNTKGFYNLSIGSYVVRYRERIEIPLDAIGLVFPRSSLLRMGATIYTAVWDPGYKGQGMGLLNVTHPIAIQKGARVAQLIFIRMETPSPKGYQGIYHNEKAEEEENK